MGDAKGKKIDYRLGAQVRDDTDNTTAQLLEKIWVYTVVKKLAKDMLQETDFDDIDRIKAAGVKLSLQVVILTVTSTYSKCTAV